MGTDVSFSALPAYHDAVRSHTIVVGAGPAGLAVGACLKRAGIPCLILEQSNQAGSAWHRHYDRLHLHTDKAHSELPFFPYPKDYPRYPSRLQVIPILTIGIAQRKLPPRWVDALNAPLLRVVVGDLRRYGLRPSPHGPLSQIQRNARIPLIDVGTIRLIKRGQIIVYPGIERFTEDGVIFTDGKQRKFAAVVLATGYRPRVNAFLEGASTLHDENGAPSSSGCETQVPGLYFCGFYVSPTGMLREIALEARRISYAIAQNNK